MISNRSVGTIPARGSAATIAAELPPTRVSVSPRVLERDPARRLAYLAVLGLMILKVSTVNEIIHSLIGQSLHLLYIFGPPAIFGTIMAGGLARTFRHKLAWIWLAFGAWLAISTPFSFWVGASIKVVFGYFRDDFAMMLLIAGTVVSWQDCRNVIRAGMVGVMIPVLYSLLRGGGTAGTNSSKMARLRTRTIWLLTYCYSCCSWFSISFAHKPK